MKKGNLYLFGFFIFILILGFAGADETSDFCKNYFSYSAECGTYLDNNTLINCGACQNGMGCILGKCYTNIEIQCSEPTIHYEFNLKNETIKIIPNEELPECNLFSGGSYDDPVDNPEINKLYCKDFGCDWDEQTLICSGNPKKCSELTARECTGGTGYSRYCQFEKPFPVKELSWQIGDNFQKSPNSWATYFYITGTKLNKIREGETIPIKISYEFSGLAQGTEVIFEIYYLDKIYSYIGNVDTPENGGGKIIFPEAIEVLSPFKYSEKEFLKTYTKKGLKDVNPIGIKTGDQAIVGIVDSKGDVKVQFEFNANDLDQFNYDGRASISARLSLKNGTTIIPLGFISDYAEERSQYSGKEINSYFDKIHNLLILESINSICTGSNLVPCNEIKSENTCNTFSQSRDFKERQDFLANEGIGETQYSCWWDDSTDSCIGSGFSCFLASESKNECNLLKEYGCNWESTSFWQRFKNFISSLF